MPCLMLGKTKARNFLVGILRAHRVCEGKMSLNLKFYKFYAFRAWAEFCHGKINGKIKGGEL